MKEISLPFKQVIFVCVNSRAEGQRISCAGAGRCGQTLLDQLKEAVKKNNLQESIRVSKSGCLEQCENGPAIALLPQNKFLTHVSESDLVSIIKTYVKKSDF